MNSQRSGGFTLPEVLVVIGMACILVWLLFPAASRLMRQSQSATCLHNLRQLGMAVALWRQDRNDRLAPPLQQVSWRPSRYLFESGLVSTASLFCCPSASARAAGAWYDVEVSSWGDPYHEAFLQRPVSYGVNTFAFYQGYPSGWGGGITMTTTYKMFVGHEMNVPLFFDAAGFQINHAMWKDPYRTTSILTRHHHLSNVVFLDGHVESLDREGVRNLHPLGNRGKIY